MLFQHKIQAGFGVAIACLLLTGVTAWRTARRNMETFRQVEHSYEVLDRLEDILEEMLDTETGNRGFAISGSEEFLKPFEIGTNAVPKTIAEAIRLTQDHPDQQRRLADLAGIIQRKISLGNEAINLRRSGDTTASLQLIASGQGKQMMDDIRRLILQMEQA